MMTKVEGSGNDHLYECTVPGENVIWNLAIPVRFNPIAELPGWHDAKWNQTNDITFNSSNHSHNVLKVTDWDAGEVKAETITRSQRIEMYGQYFLDTVSCSGSGASDSTTAEQWLKVKTQYQNMHTDYQGDVWMTVADSDVDATKIAQAMARYDYIVLYKKYSGHEDFINRASSPNKTTYSSSMRLIEPYSDSKSVSMIAIIATISLVSVSILIVSKKIKTKGTNL